MEAQITKTFHSRIKKYFNADLILELEKLAQRYDVDNNKKCLLIYALLNEAGISYEKLGPGTNRLAVQIEGYVFKFALDKLGMMDNRREFKYSPELYPDVIKVYECLPRGLIAVTEYVTVFDKDMYYQYTDKMRKILERLCQRYLIGDIGVSTNNYMNWGARDDGSICSLDFAYIYDITSTAFQCTCQSHTYIEYDKDYNFLICPSCHRKFSFVQIRRRISDQAEESEVGDIRNLGYVLHEESETKTIDPKLSIFMKSEKEDDKKDKGKHYTKTKKKNLAEEQALALDIDEDERLRLISNSNEEDT